MRNMTSKLWENIEGGGREGTILIATVSSSAPAGITKCALVRWLPTAGCQKGEEG